MNRVLVIGSGGSGKTTFARRLAARTGLPLFHLDQLYWHPGWEATPVDEWQRNVHDLIRSERWILDGNYGGTLEMRLAACDTVVFLDVSRLTCLWRVLKRQIRHRGQVRPELPPGCPERLTWEFMVWIWTYPHRRRGAILTRLHALADRKRIVILRSASQMDKFLSSTP